MNTSGSCSTPFVNDMNSVGIGAGLTTNSDDWAADFDDYTTRTLLDDGTDWATTVWPDLDSLMNGAEPQTHSEGYCTDGSPLSSPMSTVVSSDAASPGTVDSVRANTEIGWNGDDLVDFLSEHILDTGESEDSAVSLSRSSSSSGASTNHEDILAKLLSETIDANVFADDRQGPCSNQVLQPATSTANQKLHAYKPATSRQHHAPVTSLVTTSAYQVPIHQQQQPAIALVQTASPTPIVTTVPVAYAAAQPQQILVVTTNGPIVQQTPVVTQGQYVHAPVSRRSSIASSVGVEKPSQRCGPYMPIRPKHKNGPTPVPVATPTPTPAMAPMTAMEICETNTVSSILIQAANAPISPQIPAIPAPQISTMSPGPRPGRLVMDMPEIANDDKLSPAEAAAIKRQCRMIRNREAATMSRQRKKEFVQSLQDRLNEVIVENDKLKRENVVLRDTVASLQAENEKLRGCSNEASSAPSNGTRLTWTNGTKATVCVFALVFLLSINIGSYWNSYYPQQLQPVAVSQLEELAKADAMAPMGAVISDNYVAGRRLLYVGDSRELSTEDGPKQKHDRNSSRTKRNGTTNETLVGGGGEMNNASSTPTCLLFNRTESLMLAERLNSWARQHENERTSRYKLKKRPADPSMSTDTVWNEADEAEIAAFWSGANGDAARYRLKNGDLSSKADAIGDLASFPRGAAAAEIQYSEPTLPAQRRRGRTKEAGGEKAIERRKLNGSKQWSLQIYEGNELKYVKFLEALHRRDDTFYVISFLRDYLLLPANSFNKTARPRMSLVMPALPLNESMQPPPHHVAMMQIECEVTGTSLLHLPEALIPSFLLQNPNNGSSTFDHKSGSAPSSRDAPAAGPRERNGTNEN